MPEVEGNLAYIEEHTFEDLPGYIPLATKKMQKPCNLSYFSKLP